MTANTYSSLWFRLFMPLQSEEWTAKDVAFLARQLPLPPYRRLLDLCCGYGRHAVRLAALGYEVTGLDRDEAAVAEARRRTTEAGQDVAYIEGDMRNLAALPGDFDAAINMWQSFSYFDEATNIALLRDIHGKLTPAGRFIVDMYNRDYFARNQGEKRQEISGVTVETRNELVGTRWHSDLRYFDERSTPLGEDFMDWQLYTPDEFVALAAACGFTARLRCAFSDENTPPSSDIPRMVFVLERS